jgi:CO dehydrogenase maturation factor
LSFSIAIAGKGGSGKTTTAALIIRYLLRQHLTPVLAVDADGNANLHESLGLQLNRTIGSILAEFNEEKLSIPPGLTKGAYLELRLNEAVVESRGLDLLAMGRGEGTG